MKRLHYAEWAQECLARTFAGQEARDACLDSDLLEALVLHITSQQREAVNLFLINKRWRESVQRLSLWRELEWHTCVKGTRGG